jgi:hypothetical protein
VDLSAEVQEDAGKAGGRKWGVFGRSGSLRK